MADEAPATSSRSDASPKSRPASSEPFNPQEWVAHYADFLFRYALIRVRDPGAAEDLVQETLLAALQSMDRVAEAASEKAWLTGILRHKICDHFRRASREQNVIPSETLPGELAGSFDEQGSWQIEPPSHPADWGADAAGLLQRKEFMAAFRDCLNRLPARCADAFVLREMEAMESGQIQELLQISPANFWVLLHRARAQLRLCLEKTWLKL